MIAPIYKLRFISRYVERNICCKFAYIEMQAGKNMCNIIFQILYQVIVLCIKACLVSNFAYIMYVYVYMYVCIYLHTPLWFYI